MWVAIAVVIVGAGAGVKYGRHYVLAKRFAVVVPGQLYRSGYLEPWPLQRMIRKYDLETVLTLTTNEPDMPHQQKEEAVLERDGVALIRIGMPGDGRADFDLLDRAAEVIADEPHRPLLVHCAAGVHRTGAAYAAWRMKYCGWNADRALAEAGEHGITLRRKPELCEHLRRYYASRVLATGSRRKSGE